jgi:hypothetical protein
MKNIDHNYNCKLNLITSILKTNNNLLLYQIWDRREDLFEIINKFNADDFYILLTIFNHTNYIGYFFIKHKLLLADQIDELRESEIVEHFKEWIALIKETTDFTEVLRVEKIALNLLLEKMILKGHSSFKLEEDLEKIKISLFEGNEKLRNRCFRFKTKIVCSKSKERDLYQTLESIIKNNHSLELKDVMYLKQNYYPELALLNSKF